MTTIHFSSAPTSHISFFVFPLLSGVLHSLTISTLVEVTSKLWALGSICSSPRIRGWMDECGWTNKWVDGYMKTLSKRDQILNRWLARKIL